MSLKLILGMGVGLRQFFLFQTTSDDLWSSLRVDYTRVTNFCNFLDTHISNLVLLSFTNNLYFIIMQVFYSLKHTADSWKMSYFYFSMIFIVIRVLCVLIYASWVNDESIKPVQVLHSINSFNYSLEVSVSYQNINNEISRF